MKSLDSFNFHDCKIHGVYFNVDGGNSDIVFDIDYICEWDCAGSQFKVAPALLTFHDVTDFKWLLDWGKSGYCRAVMNPLIEMIERESAETNMRLPEYYKWIIKTLGDDSDISFGASGFSFKLTKQPVFVAKQYLSKEERN